MDEETTLQLHQWRGVEDAPSGYPSGGYFVGPWSGHGNVLQPTYHGYSCPAKEERTTREAGSKGHPILQTNQDKELGARRNYQTTSPEEGSGQDWTHVMPKDDGPDIRKCYKTPQRQETTETNQACRSPLTEELLAPGEHVTTVLDDQYEDPEIEQAIVHIPPHTDPADVEMEDATLGFEPKVSHSGYDVNLVQHSGDTVPGSTSLVTAQENQLLDEDAGLTRAPGTGRPGTEENPGRPITKKK